MSEQRINTLKLPYPWTDRQRDLIWKSVEHWLKNWQTIKKKGNRAMRYLPIYSTNCPLCSEYLDSMYDEEKFWEGCGQCPIRQHTGSPNCRNTPWHEVLRNVPTFDTDNDELKTDKALAAIKEEYVFLVELALGERR